VNADLLMQTLQIDGWAKWSPASVQQQKVPPFSFFATQNAESTIFSTLFQRPSMPWKKVMKIAMTFMGRHMIRRRMGEISKREATVDFLVDDTIVSGTVAGETGLCQAAVLRRAQPISPF
jgi:hypothetical protein